MIARARNEEGFGLIELLLSMVMLNVGILAVVAAFSSGSLALARATETSSASVLADKQMELYRALLYPNIALHAGSMAAAEAIPTYTSDAAYNASQVTVTCGTPSDPECSPTRTVTGPDGRSYRVYTYITTDQINVSGLPVGRAVKRITIVVRRSSDLRSLVRISSIFDQSTGL